MLRPLLIPGTALRVSEIALGTMNWGTTVVHDEAARLFDAYRAAGGNVFDTAHVYACWARTPEGEHGLGASERTLGRILKDRESNRRLLMIITKGGHPTWPPDYPRPAEYLAPAVIRRDLGESLERLGTDWVDLFFLHRDDRRVPVAEIIDVLNEIAAEGPMRYFGASNWSHIRIAEANEYAARKGVMGFVAAQPEFSLGVPTGGTKDGGPASANDTDTRFVTPGDILWHEKTGFPMFCYSPTARGYFATAGAKAATDFDHPESRARLARARELAVRKGATPNQVALAWIRGQKFLAVPIIGSASVAHLGDALAAPDLRLTPEEVAWLKGE
jgi:aryl-alcohol dehydrogenase-like predicted oxidoreductase